MAVWTGGQHCYKHPAAARLDITTINLIIFLKLSIMCLHQVTIKNRRRTPLMLAETIDAGLLSTAAKRKNDE